MSETKDPALVFFDKTHPSTEAGTHVLVIGVGKYDYGKGANRSPVAGDLNQLSSPPISARLIADWFIQSFKNGNKPLVSVSLLISEAAPKPYTPPRPAGAGPCSVPAAVLANVKDAARQWADRLRSHQDNMAVFYFCGHGISLGDQAALLLQDFGDPNAAYDGAIDVNLLRGTMKNSPAIQQVFLSDCCRTSADDLYRNEPAIGSRLLSVPFVNRGHSTPPQQFVLFPTISGEEAFGVKDSVSVFTNAIVDAMGFAAADDTTGVWRTTTGNLLNAVDLLVSHRIPERMRTRTKPNALDASSFDFNEIDAPAVARSFVTISDLELWGKVELECSDAKGMARPHKKHSRELPAEMSVCFTLDEGRWRFRGVLPQSPPMIEELERTIRVPVAYVTLKVRP